MLSSPLTTKHSQQDLLLVKDNLAAYFREEIISGRFAPGEKIVEVKWAKLLKISQTSVREALNILLAEGFVQKGSGRTAQVTHAVNAASAGSGRLKRSVCECQPPMLLRPRLAYVASSARMRARRS